MLEPQNASFGIFGSAAWNRLRSRRASSTRPLAASAVARAKWWNAVETGKSAGGCGRARISYHIPKRL